MRRFVYAILLAGLASSATVPGLAAAPCRNDMGKFVKCPPAPKMCRDAKGKFTKCGA